MGRGHDQVSNAVAREVAEHEGGVRRRYESADLAGVKWLRAGGRRPGDAVAVLVHVVAAVGGTGVHFGIGVVAVDVLRVAVPVTVAGGRAPGVAGVPGVPAGVVRGGVCPGRRVAGAVHRVRPAGAGEEEERHGYCAATGRSQKPPPEVAT